MSRKRTLSLSDDSNRDRLEKITGHQLRSIIRQAHDAQRKITEHRQLLKSAHESSELKERPTHLQVLDELRTICIDSDLPVQRIVDKVRGTPARRGNLINQQLIGDWRQYESDLWRWNEPDLRNTSGESRDFFDRFVAQLTFGNLFTNDMWPAGRILEASPNRYPSLSNQRNVDLVHFGSAVKEEKEETKQEETPFLFEHAASITEFVLDLMHHADTKAQFLVLNQFEEHTMRPFVERMKQLLSETSVELAKLTLCDESPDVDALASLDKLCEATRVLWKGVVETTDTSHDEVKKFLLDTQQHMHDLEIKYSERAKHVSYEEPLASWLTNKTDMARTRLSLDYLQRISAQTDQLLRDSAYIVRLLDVRNGSSIFAFAVPEKKAKIKTHTLATVGDTLKHAISEFERRYAEQTALLDEKKNSHEIGSQRTEALTCAVHLDYVEWVRAILNAIGRAFIDAEDHEGQLKQRVDNAISRSGAPLSAKIDAVRAKEKTVCQRVQRELAGELKLGQELFARFASLFANTAEMYKIEASHAKTMIHQRVFQHHEPWMKLQLTDGALEMRALWEVAMSVLPRMDRGVIQARMPSDQHKLTGHSLVVATSLDNVEKWTRFLIELCVAFLCRIWIEDV